MILVPHYVGSSSIAGLGLFTAVELPAGTPVYRFDERFVIVLPEAEIARMPAAAAESVRKYSYRGRGVDRLRDAVYYCADDSRFMNHARPPTTEPVDNGAIYRTTRDLPAHTELTCDYAAFSEPGDFCFAFENESAGDRLSVRR